MWRWGGLIEQWNLSKFNRVYTTDSFSSNVAAFKDVETIGWVPCMAHVIHNVIKHGIEKCPDVLALHKKNAQYLSILPQIASSFPPDQGECQMARVAGVEPTIWVSNKVEFIFKVWSEDSKNFWSIKCGYETSWETRTSAGQIRSDAIEWCHCSIGTVQQYYQYAV